MKRIVLLLFVLVAALGAFVAFRQRQPPVVPFVKVRRETIVSTLTTNGKVEPIEFAVVRSERSGPVGRILVQKGQRVSQGAVLLELENGQPRSELAAAEARIAQARAELQVVTSGGRAPEQAEIESGLARARFDLETAQKDLATNRRLLARNAATQREVTEAEDRVRQAQLQIQALDRRRGALVTAPDRAIAEARLRDAEATASNARLAIEQGTVRSPMDGVLYQFDVRPGAFLNPGDQVGSVGRLDRLRVTLYVDEPELGRVAVGMPVTITWAALPGRHWNGTIERVPSQVTSLGSRQVGEVSSVIDNPSGELLPGTNVDAEIRSQVVESALSIPRDTLRKENGETGVYALQGDKLAWRKVKVGVSSVTRAQVLEGLSENDAIARPTDQPLKPGDAVSPTFP